MIERVIILAATLVAFLTIAYFSNMSMRETVTYVTCSVAFGFVVALISWYLR